MWCQMFHDDDASFVLWISFSFSYLQDARPQTVLVENPKTLDDKGKLVSLISRLYISTIYYFKRRSPPIPPYRTQHEKTS